jgi:hypothetical protein
MCHLLLIKNTTCDFKTDVNTLCRKQEATARSYWSTAAVLQCTETKKPSRMYYITIVYPSTVPCSPYRHVGTEHVKTRWMYLQKSTASEVFSQHFSGESRLQGCLRCLPCVYPVYTLYIRGITKFWDHSGVWPKVSLGPKLKSSWDSQQDRDRKTSVLVLAVWNFKLKVLKYPRNCRLHAILILKV